MSIKKREAPKGLPFFMRAIRQGSSPGDAIFSVQAIALKGCLLNLSSKQPCHCLQFA